MTEVHTVARPYAKAVFQLAERAVSSQEWSDTLQLIAAIISDQRTKLLLKNPMVTVAEKAKFVIDVGGAKFNEQAKAFINLLATSGRLLISAEIYALYEQYRIEAERTLIVEICSAIVLDTKQREQIHNAVSKYFGKTIICNWTQDPSLIGGFIAKADDEVFDGSIRGQLRALYREMVAH
jgi:F-type H+-transporting ATPase subunit delta